MANNANILRPASFYTEGILRSDPAILSKAITLVESTRADHKHLGDEIIDQILPYTGKSFRLGITGVPGVGKSTFIESFGKLIVEKGHRLAVLAVDPSSHKSKGSILGDKTRMEELSGMKNVFIRPSPSSGTLGGVTPVTYQTMLLCEAAGHDYIIIETVGVGQSEMAVSGISDFFLLLMLAGAGDELQGIKRGIMEMADSIVITKADGHNMEKAASARVQYQNALHLLQQPESGFLPQVKTCSSIDNNGINEIYDLIESYQNHCINNGYLIQKRKEQQMNLMRGLIENLLLTKFYSNEKVHQAILQLKDSEKNVNLFSLQKAESILDLFLKGK